MFQVAGWENDMHGLTHAANQRGVSDAVAWHVKQLARLTKKLGERTEADGSTLLDHSAAVLIFEGGHGFAGEFNKGDSSHSTENMCVLIAGRAGGLAAGRHVRAVNKHPANVVLSAMRAVGVRGPLGEVADTIPGLFA
jgi:hypothetical protein